MVKYYTFFGIFTFRRRGLEYDRKVLRSYQKK